MALLLCCLVHSDIDPPFHLSSFSCAPSSTLHLYLSFFRSFFLCWIREWRSLLALTEKGWRCLFIWRVLEPWLRRGGSSKADATSAMLVLGPPLGFWPTHTRKTRSEEEWKNTCSEIRFSRERTEVWILAGSLSLSPSLSHSFSLPVLTAKLIINECGFCWTLERCQQCSHWGLRNLDI